MDYPTSPEQTLQLHNYDIDAIVTPIKVNELRRLLQQTGYDIAKTQFLCDGFTNGFKVGYNGPKDVRITSNNLQFRVGNKFDLWHKVMLEVQSKRYAGPYEAIEQIPFPGDGSATGWIQAPCGLVDKAGGKTRLINHHSYPPGCSFNDGIDDDHAKVAYQDLQDAVKISLQILKEDPKADIHYSKLDGKNAFRVLSLHPHERRWQVVKAENPLTGKFVYFVDLCISFGSRASCFLYECFSTALAHIYSSRAGIPGVSYLDDALQIGPSHDKTNEYLGIFMDICHTINMPISPEKTVYATQIIIFLGTTLNAVSRTLQVPVEKVAKALNQLDHMINAKKTTVLHLQKLTGLLNFFCRAIVPGRAFTRRLYSAYAGNAMRPHHHLRVTSEMKLDLGIWRSFLSQDEAVLRPFIDFDDETKFSPCPVFSDAAKSSIRGYSACFLDYASQTAYHTFDMWEPGFLEQCDPSVQFLELIALSIGVVLFTPLLRNRRVKIFCDNQAVVQMVNNGASSCKFCMILIRRITLCTLLHNVALQVEYISSEDNYLADSLSRIQLNSFLSRLPSGFNQCRLTAPAEFFPMGKFFDKRLF